MGCEEMAAGKPLQRIQVRARGAEREVEIKRGKQGEQGIPMTWKCSRGWAVVDYMSWTLLWPSFPGCIAGGMAARVDGGILVEGKGWQSISIIGF